MSKFLDENNFKIFCPRCGGDKFTQLYHHEIRDSEHKSMRLVLACNFCFEKGIESKKTVTYYTKPKAKLKGVK